MVLHYTTCEFEMIKIVIHTQMSRCRQSAFCKIFYQIQLSSLNYVYLYSLRMAFDVFIIIKRTIIICMQTVCKIRLCDVNYLYILTIYLARTLLVACQCQ